ncbi:MAG: type II toxin-antitoxin system VapC family toxin [Terracidiphilus sp.]
MRLLLDTHIFYWSFYERFRLPHKALDLINEAEEIFVSSASMWEIAINIRIGKLNADLEELLMHIDESGFQELPVFSRHAILVAKLPMHHTDPFDRLLIAQAISEPLHLLTVDAQLQPYSELVIQV